MYPKCVELYCSDGEHFIRINDVLRFLSSDVSASERTVFAEMLRSSMETPDRDLH